MTNSSRFFLATSALALGLALGALQTAGESLPGVQSEYMAKYEPILTSVSAMELPATSARLVTNAQKSQKEPVALAVVRVVSKVNPSALPPVVGAISQAEPSVAGKIATEASKLQPKLTSAIKGAVIITTQPTANSPTIAPQNVRDPLPTGGDPLPTGPDPDPTNGNGKKRGHYKGTPAGPPGQDK